MSPTRRPTSPGIPTPIEREVTPLPHAPPPPDRFEQLELAEQIRAVYETQREQDVALARMWGSRNIGEEIGHVRAQNAEALARLEALVDIPELLRQHGNHLERLGEWRGALDKTLDRLSETVAKLDAALDQVERDQDKLGIQLEAFMVRIEEALGSTSRRIAVVDEQHDRLAARVAELEKAQAVSTALTTRQKASLGGIAAIAGTLAAWLAKYIGIGH